MVEREERHDAARERILDVAWRLSRLHGLAGWSMRELAAELDMRAPSLYVYFPRKDAIFDAMFRQGYGDLLHAAQTLNWALNPRDNLQLMAHEFFTFATSDHARMQLMFWRVVPGFQPSAESYAESLKVSTFLEAECRRLGIEDPEASAVWMALMIGLITQQGANDPQGTSWEPHLETLVEMFGGRYLPE